MGDPIWNVRVTVVDLVPAPTGDEAIAKLAKRLNLIGVNLHEDGPAEEPDAFESEPLGDLEAKVRNDWARPLYVRRFPERSAYD